MKTKCGLSIVLGITILLWGAAGCDDDVIKPEPTPTAGYTHYMPLDLGNKWTYDVAISIRSAPAEHHEYIYEVTEVKNNHQGFAKAYIITITKDGQPGGTLTAGYRDNSCYIYNERWRFLLADAMAEGTETETGLVWAQYLTYEWDDDVTVPAGAFSNCKLLRFLYAEVDATHDANEYYAKDVGLVRYAYSYEYREFSMPHEPYDWGTITYDLTAYEINHSESK